METNFVNSKGEITTENSNYFAELLTENWKAKIYRDGQDKPESSNDVCVMMVIETIKVPMKFDRKIFDISLSANFHSKINNTTTIFFYAKTWKEAFKKAIDCFQHNTEVYYDLVKERKQALIDAEL